MILKGTKGYKSWTSFPVYLWSGPICWRV